MAPSPTPSQPGNPYRRPRPHPAETIAADKFYLANKKGSYGVKTSPVQLALCAEYLWVSDTLSIPLATITETGLSKHGGFIRFWDALAGAEIEFNFTKLGFLRFKRKHVEALLAIIDDHRPADAPLSGTEPAAEPPEPEIITCEKCGSADVRVFVFHVLRFVGIAPIAYSYKLTPFRYVLCTEHARSEALACARRTALAGYLGFPGFLAAPFYICRDLWSLRRARAADLRTVLLCLLLCILLPWAILATPIILLAR